MISLTHAAFNKITLFHKIKSDKKHKMRCQIFPQLGKISKGGIYHRKSKVVFTWERGCKEMVKLEN